MLEHLKASPIKTKKEISVQYFASITQKTALLKNQFLQGINLPHFQHPRKYNFIRRYSNDVWKNRSSSIAGTKIQVFSKNGYQSYFLKNHRFLPESLIKLFPDLQDNKASFYVCLVLALRLAKRWKGRQFGALESLYFFKKNAENALQEKTCCHWSSFRNEKRDMSPSNSGHAEP